MPEFAFTARDPQGVSQTGTLTAANASALADTLRQRGWLVTQVRAVEKKTAVRFSPAVLSPGRWLPVRSIDVEVSLQQIATMLRSGLTLLASLDVVVRQAQRRSMSNVWALVSRRIQEGSGFADAMAQHRCFNRLVIQLVRVGEHTGTLDHVLARAADSLESKRNLRAGLITAMIYPTIVLVMAVAVTAFMVLNVIPKLSVVLGNLGAKLPAMTQMLMDISAWINTYLITMTTVGGAIIAALIALYLWRPGRLAMDRLALRIPVIGRLLRLAATAAFAHTLAIMLRSGVTVLEGLRTLGNLHHNRYLLKRINDARQNVLEGGSLADPLTPPGAYMPMLASMVSVGEYAGTLDDTLSEVAQFHEKQLQSAIKRFSAIIEPVIILVVGSIVGFVYIAFFMALFSVAGGVR